MQTRLFLFRHSVGKASFAVVARILSIQSSSCGLYSLSLGTEQVLVSSDSHR